MLEKDVFIKFLEALYDYADEGGTSDSEDPMLPERDIKLKSMIKKLKLELGEDEGKRDELREFEYLKEIIYSDRGFQWIYWKDRNGKNCRLSQSSIVPGMGAIWLGCRAGDSIHLDRRMVVELIQRLNTWLKTGRFDGDS